MKSKSKLKFYSLILLVLSCSSSALAKGTYCASLSPAYSQRLKTSFKHNPIEFIDSFINISSSPKNMSNIKYQNALLAASFDIKSLYKSNAKNFKSKVLSNIFFDWVRTQYFGNLDKNYLQKKNYLLSKNFDLLTSLEREQMKSFTPLITSFEQRGCTKKESQLLGCSKNLFKVGVQLIPEISCKKKEIKNAFNTEFFLTYSSKYGFKILDLKLSGKRIVMDTVDYMFNLQLSGFNKSAISTRLQLLSKNKKTFRIPRRQINTKRFLAKFQRKNDSNEERIPASL